MKDKIEVLIVDDSAVVRRALTEILAADPEIEVMATAADPLIAAEKIRRRAPDVITLDVEMPRMDGLTFLRKIMAQHPLPVVMCSSLTARNAELSFKALQYGAVEIINKPRLGVKGFLEESKVLICDAVKAACRARLRPGTAATRPIPPKMYADAVIRPLAGPEVIETTEKVVVVAASTGGTEALRVFLEALPHDGPGVVIVQHMPEHFTAAFARRLDGVCRMAVKEAANGDSVIPGRVLIAPGNRHLLLKRSGTRYFIEVKDGPLVCRHRPSADVLFRSTARYAGVNAIGVIMTGMGDDGARGLAEMRAAGARTLAQDEASCVVFGMPGEAIRMGGVERVLPLEQIAPAVIRAAKTIRPEGINATMGTIGP